MKFRKQVFYNHNFQATYFFPHLTAYYCLFECTVCVLLILNFFFFGLLLYCRYDLHLSFEESIFGGQREIEVSCFETCDSCGGTGAKSSNCIQSCNACWGRGGVLKTQRTPFGLISQVIFHTRSWQLLLKFCCLQVVISGAQKQNRQLTYIFTPLLFFFFG